MLSGRNLAYLPEFLYNNLVRRHKLQIISQRFKPAQRVRVTGGLIAGEETMGKYIGYFLIILVILFALEYFQIVDIPYFDIPDLQTKGEAIKSKSTDNMKRQFGD